MSRAAAVAAVGVDVRVGRGCSCHIWTGRTCDIEDARSKLSTGIIVVSTLTTPCLAATEAVPVAASTSAVACYTHLLGLRRSLAVHTSLSSFSLALRALISDYYSTVPFSDVVRAWMTGKGPQRLQSMTTAELLEMQRVYGTDGQPDNSNATPISAADYRQRVLDWLTEWDVERALFLFGCRYVMAAGGCAGRR